MAPNDNIDRLKSEGILSPYAVLTPDDQAALESLTHGEVDAIISIRNKLGTGFMDRHATPRADFIF
jgi:hypothetical protein